MSEVVEYSERNRRCWKCSAPVSHLDKYCHNCAAGLGDRIPWYYSRLGIIVATVAALGPFSLYLVWKSPKLSATERKVYAAGIVLFTVFLVVSFMKMYNMLSSALAGYDTSQM